MSRRWVADASPLIVLARIGRVDLLPALAAELVIPKAVEEEIRRGAGDDPARRWLEGDGKQHLAPAEPIAPVVAAWDLGRGEGAVLSWAYSRPGWEAIVDDRAARTCATAIGVPVRGTVGVVLLAKREGKVGSIGLLTGMLPRCSTCPVRDMCRRVGVTRHR